MGKRFCMIVALALLWPLSSPAGTTLWSGAVGEVLEDTGGVYTGTMVGDRFNGQHSVPDVCVMPDCMIEPQGANETNYVLASGTAFVSDGATQVDGLGASVNVQDDETLDADDVALVFQLTGIQLNVGDPVDVWSGGSESADGSIEWEITYVSFDDNLYNDTAYRPNPPAASEIDLVLFLVSEDDGGTEVFAVVPEPAWGAATTAALLVLFGLGARRARGASS